MLAIVRHLLRCCWFGLVFHGCLWQETLFGSLPVLSALPSEEEDLRGLDRSGNVALIVKVRFAGDAGEWRGETHRL